MAEQETIIQSYPADITSPENARRCIKLLVKENDALSSISELKEKLSRTIGDGVDVFNNIIGNAPSSEQRQVELKNRTAKLTQATTVYACSLALPNELNDSQSHDWSTSKGFVGRAGELLDPISKIVGEVSSSAGFRKPLVDPGYFQDYNGTEPREFRFTWDFIPNSVDEAKSVYSIIYNLKKYTLPAATVSGVSLLSPFMFDIIVGNDRINSLMNMNNVVCKSMSINYSAEGSLQFLPDGTPKFMKLEMTFAERATVTADMY